MVRHDGEPITDGFQVRQGGQVGDVVAPPDAEAAFDGLDTSEHIHLGLGRQGNVARQTESDFVDSIDAVPRAADQHEDEGQGEKDNPG